MKRGRPFEPGNKFGQGRPTGSRNRRTQEAQELIYEYKDPIIKKCIAKALEGDLRAIALCIERILPPQRDTAVRFKRKRLDKHNDMVLASKQVVEDVAKGILTPQEGERLYGMVSDLRDYTETEDMDARLTALEQNLLPKKLNTTDRR